MQSLETSSKPISSLKATLTLSRAYRTWIQPWTQRMSKPILSPVLGVSRVSSWSFNLAVNSQDFPKLYFRTAFGCDELRWDVSVLSWLVDVPSLLFQGEMCLNRLLARFLNRHGPNVTGRTLLSLDKSSTLGALRTGRTLLRLLFTTPQTARLQETILPSR